MYQLYQRINKIGEDSDTRFEEIFKGFRKNKFALGYNLMLIARRAIMVVWIICFQWILTTYYLIGTAFIQFLQLSVVATVRPFDKVKDNLVEIVNESVLF
jgi:hypothetical protein